VSNLRGFIKDFLLYALAVITSPEAYRVNAALIGMATQFNQPVMLV
jgi:acetyl-CoA carboxylase alpha subunit